MKRLAWIGVDWGTTNLRVFSVDATGQTIDEKSSDLGMAKLEPNRFESALLSLIEPWLLPDRKIPVYATASLAPLGDHSEIDALCDRLDQLRSAFGNQIDIAIDLHGRVPRSAFKCLVREVEQFKLSWIEEPCTPENLDALKHLSKACSHIPIATGERLSTAWDFKLLLESSAVDIVQPDISLIGFDGLKRIAQLAELYDVSVAPHSPNGPICLAASLQAGVCQANVAIQETSWGLHYNQGYGGLGKAEMSNYVVDASPLQPVDGWISRPEGVGLGIEIREDVVAAASSDRTLMDSDWRHKDGSWSEW